MFLYIIRNEVISGNCRITLGQERKEIRSMNIEEIEKIDGIEYHEKIKLIMDYERIRIERFKAWGTILAILIPLIVAIITIIYSIRSEYEKAKNDFEIKAVEIVMSASSPQAATNKAIVLYELFPKRLPVNFKETMLNLYGKSGKEDNQ